MKGKITVGSYYNTDSFLHRMDPRVKLVLMVVFMVSIFLAKLPWGLIAVAAMLVLMVAASRVPLRQVARACKPLLFFVVLTVIVNIVLVRDGNVAFHLGPFAVTDQALMASLLLGFRIFALMLSGVVLSLTTSPVGITDGLERLLSPLEKLGMPCHELAMMYTIAIRFVPTLASEANHIMTAQAARGASLDDGKLMDRLRFLGATMVPLFASALRHAEELACAMEARCYVGGEGRTHYHVLKVRRRDWVGIGVFCVYLVALVVIGVCF